MMERDLDQEAIIMQQAIRLKAPLPDKIAKTVDLEPGMEFYLDVYIDLCADKNVGFGEGPIPWLSLNEYAKRYNITGNDFERLVSVIRIADSELIKQKQKIADRKSKNR